MISEYGCFHHTSISIPRHFTIYCSYLNYLKFYHELFDKAWCDKIPIINLVATLLFILLYSFYCYRLLPCTVQLAKVIQKTGCDVLCIIDRPIPQELEDQFCDFRSLDKGFDSFVSCFRSTTLQLPIVYSPLPELTDYHDVRSYKTAAAKSLERAIKGGFKSPLLVVPQSTRFVNAELCTVLGALEELYVVKCIKINLLIY